MKKSLLVVGTMVICSFTVGAATGSKITAELKGQTVNCNGGRISQNVISYEGSTYVPLRTFATMVGVDVDYIDGEIYIESPVKEVIAEKPVEPEKKEDKIESTRPTSKYDIDNPAPDGATQQTTFNGHTYNVTVKNSRIKLKVTNEDTGEYYWYVEADVDVEMLSSSTNRDETRLYGLFTFHNPDGGSLVSKTWDADNDIREKLLLPGQKVSGTISNQIKQGEKYILSFGFGSNKVYFQL